MTDRVPFVLGRQAADAAAADAAHVRGPAPFPFPEGAYEPAECDLLRAPPSALDAALTDALRRAAAGGPPACAALRDSLDGARFDTLLTYGNRAAVRAMRARDVAIVRDGLVAAAVIDASRTDYRDVGMTLSLLQHAARRIDADAPALFQEAASLALPRTAALMAQGVTPAAMAYPLSGRAGMREFATAAGPGFIASGIGPYEPTLPLDRIAFDVLAMVEADGYRADVELGTRLPGIWLSEGIARTIAGGLTLLVRAALGRLREMPDPNPELKARATAVVRASGPRTGGTEGTTSRWVWILEMADADTARELQRRADRHVPGHFARLAVHRDRVFLLVVDNGVPRGAARAGAIARLRRMEPVLRDILARHVAPGGASS